jgi:hypothetical protein
MDQDDSMARVTHTSTKNDEAYLDIIRSALRVCLSYKPAFGQGRQGGVTLAEFQKLYREDEFYSWFGLDSPLVYAAHRAAGGMTSVYRQIGIGCEAVFQRILRDSLELSDEDAAWSYQLPKRSGKARRLSLDGRIPIDRIGNTTKRDSVSQWLRSAAASVGLAGKHVTSLDGCVFEVRQGYKSNDAKRQNADVANASSAYAHRYLPVMMVLSTQIPDSLAERYGRARWLLLRGTVGGSPTESSYAFCREVLGYDLAGFFRRHCDTIRSETKTIFEGLLK